MAEGDAGVEAEIPAVSSGREEASVIEGHVKLTSADLTAALAHLAGLQRARWVPVVDLVALTAWHFFTIDSAPVSEPPKAQE